MQDAKLLLSRHHTPWPDSFIEPIYSESERKAFIRQSFTKSLFSVEARHHVFFGHWSEIINIKASGRETCPNVRRNQPVVELRGNR
jgi:hypothetical protein